MILHSFYVCMYKRTVILLMFFFNTVWCSTTLLLFHQSNMLHYSPKAGNNVLIYDGLLEQRKVQMIPRKEFNKFV